MIDGAGRRILDRQPFARTVDVGGPGRSAARKSGRGRVFDSSELARRGLGRAVLGGLEFGTRARLPGTARALHMTTFFTMRRIQSGPSVLICILI